MEVRAKYKARALKYAQEHHTEISEHILDILISVMLSRDKIQKGGSFVEAVCSNQLAQAINRADNECMQNLKLIVNTYNNAYIEQNY